MTRQFVRRRARRVQVRFWTDADPRVRVGYTRNISERGIFVGTNAPFRPGTEVEMDLVAGNRTHHARGRVIHAARVSPLLQALRISGMGIQLEARNPLLDEKRE